ncbi:unnamed protein product, partial [marine sediment metagenome]
PVYTAGEGIRGRRPGIEASVRHGVTRPGIAALDGKDNVTVASVVKAAEDARKARALYPEYKWIQPVLVLPCGCDVRSDAILAAAIEHRVIIATTALPTRPLSLAG